MLKPFDDHIDQLAFVYAYSGLKKDHDNRIYSIAAAILDTETPRRDFSSHIHYTLSTERERYYSNISKEILLSAPPREEVFPKLKEFLRDQKFLFAFNNHNNISDTLTFTGNIPIIDLSFAAEFFLPHIESYTPKAIWEYLFKKNHETISFTAVEMIDLSIEFVKHICGEELNDRAFPRAASIRYYLKKSDTLFGKVFTHVATNHTKYFSGLIHPCSTADTENWEQFLENSMAISPENNEKQPYKKIPLDNLEYTYRALAGSNKDIKYRESQLGYATHIAGALNDKAILTIEAGTGTGKTQGYLIPVMEFLYRNPNAHIAISTYTKNLQNQIFQREVGITKSINKLYKDIPVALLKGKSNYICVEKLGNMHEEELQGKKLLAWLYLLNVVFHFRDADGDAVGDKVKSYLEDGFSFYQLQNEISSKTGCDHKHIKCPAQIVTAEAFFARLVITNHFKLALLDSEPYLVGRFKNYIIDEANHFENAVRHAFGIEVSSRDIIDSVEYIESALKKIAPRATGDYAKNFEKVFSAITKTQREILLLGNTLRSINQNGDIGEINELPNDRTASEEGGIQNNIISLRSFLKEIIEHLKFLKNNDTCILLEIVSRKAERIKAVLDQLNDYAESLAEIEKSFIYLNNIIAYQVFHRNWFLILQPVDVAELIKQNIYSKRDSIIYTSATICRDHNFEMFKRIVGLSLIIPPAEQNMTKELRFVAIPSPFPRDIMEVFVHKAAVNGSFKNKGIWVDTISKIIPELVKKNRGRSLVLFSSYDDLSLIVERISEEITSAGYPLLVQQNGYQTNNISDEFRAIKESVLFGVDTFWYGVDYKGDTLTQVIITRIPYPSPSNPIQMARKRMMSSADYRARYFYDTDIKMKQGIGRLIRSEKDRGKVVVLDSRYLSFCRQWSGQSEGDVNFHHDITNKKTDLSTSSSAIIREKSMGEIFESKKSDSFADRQSTEDHLPIKAAELTNDESKLVREPIYEEKTEQKEVSERKNYISPAQEEICRVEEQQEEYKSGLNVLNYPLSPANWSPGDDDRLISEYDQDRTIEDLSNMFQLDSDFIHARLKRLIMNEDELDKNAAVKIDQTQKIQTSDMTDSAISAPPDDPYNKDLLNHETSKELLSTSKIASLLKMNNAKLFSILLKNNFIQKSKGEGYKLTELGKEIGGTYKFTSDNSSYIVWPEDVIQNDAFRKLIPSIQQEDEEIILSQSQEQNKAYSLDEIREKHPKAYEKWSPEEDDKLLKEYAQGRKIQELAIMFQRNDGAIRARLKLLSVNEQEKSSQKIEHHANTFDKSKATEVTGPPQDTKSVELPMNKEAAGSQTSKKGTIARKKSLYFILAGIVCICFIVITVLFFVSKEDDRQIKTIHSTKETQQTKAIESKVEKKPVEGVWIKGNINLKGEKIYHMPGQEYYRVTQPEEWFETEEDAVKAGFRKSRL